MVRGNGARYQPRPHDLRHSFAVNRLTAWHRQGKDAQRLAPLLSTYLGHASVAATQVYLGMTPELLRRPRCGSSVTRPVELEAAMADAYSLGPWLRRFLEEYLVSERNLARNTQLSYRDTLALLLPFVSAQARTSVDGLAVRDLDAERVRAFLAHLEQGRGCSPRTRNQRLAAIRCFARNVAGRCPEHVAWCGQIRAIPLKKAAPPPVGYLEKHEIEALLDTPDTSTPQGRRERALLLFLYHTGARASEAAQLTVGGLQLGRQRSGPLARHLAGQGRQDVPVPAAARLGTSAGAVGPGTQSRGGGLPQPAAAADHPLRHPPAGRALRGESRPAGTVAGRQEGRTAPAAPHGGNAPAALGSRPQHHPRLAGPRPARDHDRLCRNRSPAEGESDHALRLGRTCARAVLSR